MRLLGQLDTRDLGQHLPQHVKERRQRGIDELKLEDCKNCKFQAFLLGFLDCSRAGLNSNISSSDSPEAVLYYDITLAAISPAGGLRCQANL